MAKNGVDNHKNITPTTSPVWYFNQLKELRDALQSQEETHCRKVENLQRRQEIALGVATTRLETYKIQANKTFAKLETQRSAAELKANLLENEIRRYLGGRSGVNVDDIINGIENRIKSSISTNIIAPFDISRKGSTSVENASNNQTSIPKEQTISDVVVPSDVSKRTELEELEKEIVIDSYVESPTSIFTNIGENYFPNSTPQPLVESNFMESGASEITEEPQVRNSFNDYQDDNCHSEVTEINMAGNSYQEDSTEKPIIKDNKLVVAKIDIHQVASVGEDLATFEYKIINPKARSTDLSPSNNGEFDASKLLPSRKSLMTFTPGNNNEQKTNEVLPTNNDTESNGSDVVSTSFAFGDVDLPAAILSTLGFGEATEFTLNEDSNVETALTEASKLIDRMKRALLDTQTKNDIFVKGAIGFKCRICGLMLLSEEFGPHLTSCCRRNSDRMNPNAPSEDTPGELQRMTSSSAAYIPNFLLSSVRELSSVTQTTSWTDLWQGNSINKLSLEELEIKRNEMLQEESFLLSRLLISVFLGNKSSDNHQLYAIEVQWTGASQSYHIVRNVERKRIERRFKDFVQFHKDLVSQIPTSTFLDIGWTPDREAGVLSSIMRRVNSLHNDPIASPRSTDANSEVDRIEARRYLLDRYVNVLFRIRLVRLAPVFAQFFELPLHWIL